MSTQKAQILLEYLKNTKQYFCFTSVGRFHTADELLRIVKGQPVTFDEAVAYITENDHDE